MTDHVRTADAAISCALSRDYAAFDLLIADLDVDQLREVLLRVARHCATSMEERVADAGLQQPRAVALALWQETMLARANSGE